MPSTFYARMDALERIVGDRNLTGRVIVDQPYAQIQHQKLSYHHLDGGAQYLWRPLLESHVRYLHDIASSLLNDGGRQAMIRAMSSLSTTGLRRYVPHEHNWLANSGSPEVWHDGTMIFKRPPAQRRRTQAEINKEPADDDA